MNQWFFRFVLRKILAVRFSNDPDPIILGHCCSHSRISRCQSLKLLFCLGWEANVSQDESKDTTSFWGKCQRIIVIYVTHLETREHFLFFMQLRSTPLKCPISNQSCSPWSSDPSRSKSGLTCPDRLMRTNPTLQTRLAERRTSLKGTSTHISSERTFVQRSMQHTKVKLQE